MALSRGEPASAPHESAREPKFTCKRSGFVDNECCEPCNCAETRRIVDMMGVHSYYGSPNFEFKAASMLGLTEYVSDGPYKPIKIQYAVLYPSGYKPPPPLTRWQRFKRRWSDRLERVADAWAVLRGKKFAIEDDGPYEDTDYGD